MSYKQLYEKAAGMLERGESFSPFACNVLQEAARERHEVYEPAVELMKRWFKEHDNYAWSSNWRDPDATEEQAAEQYQMLLDCRILMLCFMAQLADEEPPCSAE